MKSVDFIEHEFKKKNYIGVIKLSKPPFTIWQEYWWLGEAYKNLAEYDKAKEQFEALTQAFPKQHYGLKGLVQIAQHQKNWSAVIESATALSTAFPKMWQGYWWLGDAYIHLAEYDKAAEQFEALTQAFPKQHHGLQGLVQIAQHQKNWSTVIESATALSTAFPGMWQGYWWLGSAYIHEAEYEKAEGQFKALIRLFPKQQHGFLGMFRIKSQEVMGCCQQPLAMGFNKVKEEWGSFLKHNDSISDLYPDTLCRVNFQIAANGGQIDLFIETFLTIVRQLTLEQKKNFSMTITSIVNHQIALGDLARAKETIDLLPKDSSQSIRALINLGAKSDAYAGDAKMSVDMALGSDDKILQISANDYLLGMSMSEFSIEESEKRIAVLDNLYESKPANELPVIHVLKKQYLIEMRRCQGYDEMDPEDIHRSFLNVLQMNESHRQKVILSAYYLQRVFDGISIDHEINLGCAIRPNIVIPKNIIQYWDKNLIPDDVLACMDSIKQASAGYDHTVFNRESAADFISDNYNSEYTDLFYNSKHPALQADLFRLLYLSIFGGVWIDADEEYRPIIANTQPNDLFQQESLRFGKVIGFEIRNDFIAMAPNHPILSNIREGLNLDDCTDDKYVWWNTGPGAFTYHVAKCHAEAELERYDGETSRLRLIHASTYHGYFRSPTMEYKKTNLSWQKNITMN